MPTPAPNSIIPIGGRAVITPWAGAAAVPLTDENGIASGRELGADVEVEIVAWRPRGLQGRRYRVRSLADGVEGWVDGPQVRALPPPPSPRRPTRLPPSGPSRGGITARPRGGYR